MADQVTVGNVTGQANDYIVSADEVVASGAKVQRVKLAYSEDGSETHVPASGNGLTVGLNGYQERILEALRESAWEQSVLLERLLGEDQIVLDVKVAVDGGGGYLVYSALSAASTNATVVNAASCQLYGWYLFNTSSALKYVKVFDLNNTPVVGTDKPVVRIPLPASSGANVEFGAGIRLFRGLAFAVTGGAADTDTTAVAANDVVVNLMFK